MDEKQLRFEAYKLAQEVVLSSLSDFPRVDVGERASRIADFILAYVNNEHEALLNEYRARAEQLRKESFDRLREMEATVEDVPKKRRRWWK